MASYGRTGKILSRAEPEVIDPKLRKPFANQGKLALAYASISGRANTDGGFGPTSVEGTGAGRSSAGAATFSNLTSLL